MSGKVFIKTHGCQMNEYDSAKMLDVLAEGCNLSLTDEESEADVLLLNTCYLFDPRKSAGKGVFAARSLEEAKAEQARYADWCRRLRRKPGRRGDSHARTICRYGVWTPDFASLTRNATPVANQR
jgi:hypothetical protein